MDADEGAPVVAVGRGRGRGRGAGVPVLPEGLWNELSGIGGDNDICINDNDHTNSNANDNATEGRQRDVPDFSDDVGGSAQMPMGFGRGGRGRGGRGAGRGGRGGRGRMPDKDLKGPDWTCASCSNVNWSWRSDCNKCHTAKPVSALADNEVRDGAGGGFNERQGRVSNANVEITEDGFDDFGRRAKGRTADKRAKEAAALARLEANYGFLLNPDSLNEETGKHNVSHDAGKNAQFEDAAPKDNSNSRSSGNSSSNHRDGDYREGPRSSDHGRDRDRCGDHRFHDADNGSSASRSRKRSRSRDRDTDRDTDKGRDRNTDRNRDSDRDKPSVRESSSRTGNGNLDRDYREYCSTRYDRDRERDRETTKSRDGSRGDRDRDRDRDDYSNRSRGEDSSRDRSSWDRGSSNGGSSRDDYYSRRY